MDTHIDLWYNLIIIKENLAVFSGQWFGKDWNMPEEKKNTYTGQTDARRKATAKYLKESVEDVRIRVPKGQKAVIKSHAEKQGESMNSFAIRAIDETIDRDIAKEIAEKNNVSVEYVIESTKFAEALDQIERHEKHGADIKKQVLSGDSSLTKEEILEIGERYK